VKVVLVDWPFDWRVNLVVVAFHRLFDCGREYHINKDKAVGCNQIDHLVRLGVNTVLAQGVVGNVLN